MSASWLTFPPPALSNVVRYSRDNGSIYVGRGSAYGNPFPMHDESERDAVVSAFRSWLEHQPELLRAVRLLLPGKTLGCFCAPKACHCDVLSEVTAGLWDDRIPDEPVFVFGSNEAGRHGKGAALAAKREYGAKVGVIRGMTGNAYALPTKDAQLECLPLGRVIDELGAFFDLACATPGTSYRLTRVGCGLAGLPEEDVRDYVLEHAPDNVLLPGVWEAVRTPGLARVIVAGSRTVDDYQRLADNLDRILSQLRNVEIVSGGARGADALGERYAIERGLKLRRMPALWEIFQKLSGPIRNARMSWYGTHLAAFWDGESSGTRNMIETGRLDGLRSRVLSAA